MEHITHVFTEILFEDEGKILTKNDNDGEISYTEIEKLEGEEYNLIYNCDILKVKSYKISNELPNWY
jgi:hypothetical protein